MLQSCECVAYVVSDLAAAKAWYVENSGGTVIEDMENWVGIRLPSGQVIGLATGPYATSYPLCAFYRVDDLAAAVKQLEAAGGKLTHPITDVGPVHIAIVENPMGHPIGMQQTKAT